jgi:hypothetical protein
MNGGIESADDIRDSLPGYSDCPEPGRQFNPELRHTLTFVSNLCPYSFYGPETVDLICFQVLIFKILMSFERCFFPHRVFCHLFGVSDYMP